MLASGGGSMTTWHAFYFDNFDNTQSPVRTVVIEACDEEEAGKLAIAEMGRCVRVDVTLPIWATPSSQTRDRNLMAVAGT
jgi:hypothetical protein